MINKGAQLLGVSRKGRIFVCARHLLNERNDKQKWWSKFILEQLIPNSVSREIVVDVFGSVENFFHHDRQVIEKVIMMEKLHEEMEAHTASL